MMRMIVSILAWWRIFIQFIIWELISVWGEIFDRRTFNIYIIIIIKFIIIVVVWKLSELWLLYFVFFLLFKFSFDFTFFSSWNWWIELGWIFEMPGLCGFFVVDWANLLFLINGISSTTFRFDLMRRFCARYDAVVEMIISRKFVLSLDDDIFVNTSIIKDEMDFVDWVYGQ